MPTRSRSTRGPEPQRARGHRCWRALGVVLVVLGAVASARAAEQWVEPASGIVFIRVPAGCFEQGEAAAGPRDDGMPIPMPREDEVPRRRVCVDGFWLAKTELTAGQWAAVMGGGRMAGSNDVPKVGISWSDAGAFLGRLREIAGGERQFRLPSEAEWEYACHAGQRREVLQVYGQDRLALMTAAGHEARYNYPPVREPTAERVGGRTPNAWGFHDMLGNVWEWVADRYAADAYRHPAGAAAGVDDSRVIRGGSYKSDIAQVRCGVRNWSVQSERSVVIGMRVLMEERK